MRLIDADVLQDIVKNKYSDIIVGGYPYNVVAYDMAKLIEIQPTAYDIDKVVEQLERAKDEFSGGALQEHYYWEGIEKAIEIVKGGAA